MKYAAILLVVLLALLAANSGTGSPLKGKRSRGHAKVNAQSNVVFEEKFRGGERACVIVRGDHKPVVDLGVFVTDAKDNLVAKDEAGGDYVAAIWYPPRDAVYKIRIYNPGLEWNRCYISLK